MNMCVTIVQKVFSRSIFFIVALSVFSSGASAITLKGVKLKPNQLIAVGKIPCGKIKRNWEVGRILKSGEFISCSSERSQTLTAAQKASSSAKSKLLKQAANLKKKNLTYIAICKNYGSLFEVSNLQTPTITPTPTAAATQVPTATPIPTAAPTQIPSATPTSTVTVTQTPIPTSTPTSPPSTGGVIVYAPSAVAGCSIYAANNQFLGIISSNQFASNSIANTFGSYGSIFSSTSIFNQFSSYGGIFAMYSPFNIYSSSPPVINCGNGGVAYLTANQFRTPRVDPYSVASAIGRLSDTP